MRKLGVTSHLVIVDLLCYMAIAVVAALAIILIALMKPMKIYFDEA